ncbi:MAG: hypothetical protein EXS31_01780 [Pedosphaera sp.]|nr:hypothetical protein [Pedosphaera sp.]
MKIVFDRETQIGVCDQDWESDYCSKPDNGEPWAIYAHTMAEFTHAQGMVKIEHRCFVRSGSEIAEFPSVRPDIALEVAPDSEEEALRMVEKLHDKFVDKAKQNAASVCAY